MKIIELVSAGFEIRRSDQFINFLTRFGVGFMAGLKMGSGEDYEGKNWSMFPLFATGADWRNL